ncbi:SDR family oxidoreductase [Labrys monachus]|uniref:Uncharacterized protein YbjT (DUF2867 family) n=1 Tax=Labrys monachus TaxID=217067 RepID=A0ABU0FDT2_9HYPH|nr:SDR family oxidoreductase [Labrys monachus]MDQ0392765.1 uncharacterized protein YbjT (DUF2867 family) [Labrys monachus]
MLRLATSSQTRQSRSMRVLILGGYGLIGSSVVSAVLAAGHDVTGLGRDVTEARRRRPPVRWLQHDLKTLVVPQAWIPLLHEIDAVINASGVLQDGPGDDVMAVQRDAMIALFQACESARIGRFVQISAVGASSVAQTVFMRSKGLADEALSACAFEWIVLRPGLVLGAQVYGGSAMLHALAGMPGLIALPRAPAIRTVALQDVAEMALAALEGSLPLRRSYDLVEEEAHALDDVVRRLRARLGFPSAPIVHWPAAIFRVLFGLGDLAGWLGWHPPLRSTAFRQTMLGIDGDPRPLRDVIHRPLRSLDETLSVIDGSARERWFARLFMLKPVIIITLGLFWLVSGIVGLIGAGRAESILVTHGLSAPIASLAVHGGAFLDIALGAAMLIRRSMPAAAVGMMAVTLFYLLAGSAFAPDLWADPLGPLVKAVPAAILALVALAIRDAR